MMKIPYYIINAFTDSLFAGNPAAVCLLPHWLSTESLQKIAMENNLPVTAFLVKEKNNYEIRWLTPDYELSLCGHGTLAAAFVIFNYLEPSLHKVELHAKSTRLTVITDNGWIAVTFPEKQIESIPTPKLLTEAFHHSPSKVFQHGDERLLVIFDNEKIIQEMEPDISLLKQLNFRGITVSALGIKTDFVSRTFYPSKNPPEDAVTGVAHTFLAPYWAKQLGKNKLSAKQLSKRGGFLECIVKENEVILRGQAILYMEGNIIL